MDNSALSSINSGTSNNCSEIISANHQRFNIQVVSVKYTNITAQDVSVDVA